MSAVVNQDWRPKTYRELFIQWQETLIESWNHTARLCQFLSEGKQSYEFFHPYLKKGSNPNDRKQPITVTPIFSV